jgi:hypothetical protein
LLKLGTGLHFGVTKHISPFIVSRRAVIAIATAVALFPFEIKTFLVFFFLFEEALASLIEEN